MPVNKAFPLEVLFDAIRQYEENSKRRVTIEYILLKGLNDSLKNASELATLLKGTFAYVNLIPYNEVSENEFRRTLGWLFKLNHSVLFALLLCF